MSNVTISEDGDARDYVDDGDDIGDDAEVLAQNYQQKLASQRLDIDRHGIQA
jgi:hypothetical protein